MTDPRQLELVRHHIDEAIAHGATVRTGGSGTEGNESYYIRPTVLLEIIIKENHFKYLFI